MATYCFSVHADATACSLPRVLEVFALHGHVPEQCHAVAGGRHGDELTIDLQMSGLDAEDARLLAKRLDRLVNVSTVLFSEKRHRLCAA